MEKVKKTMAKRVRPAMRAAKEEKPAKEINDDSDHVAVSGLAIEDVDQEVLPAMEARAQEEKLKNLLEAMHPDKAVVVVVVVAEDHDVVSSAEFIAEDQAVVTAAETLMVSLEEKLKAATRVVVSTAVEVVVAEEDSVVLAKAKTKFLGS